MFAIDDSSFDDGRPDRGATSEKKEDESDFELVTTTSLGIHSILDFSIQKIFQIWQCNPWVEHTDESDCRSREIRLRDLTSCWSRVCPILHVVG